MTSRPRFPKTLLATLLVLLMAGGALTDSRAQSPKPKAESAEPGPTAPPLTPAPAPTTPTTPSGTGPAEGRVEEEVVRGTVIRLRDIDPGPSFYSDFETGGVEILLQTEDGTRRVLFGPQWQTRDINEEAFHIGHFKQGQQMMVIGFTIPLSKEGKKALAGEEPPVMAEEVRTEGRTIRREVK